jgi:hypothetical protein
MSHQHISFFGNNDERCVYINESLNMMRLIGIGEKDQNKINIKQRGGVGSEDEK